MNLAYIRSVLFENRSIKQIIAKNLIWLSVAKGAAVLTFLLNIFIARILGAAEFGKYNFALTFISLFLMLADMGLSTIITRELAKKDNEKEFSAIVALKILLGIGTFILIFLLSFFITEEQGIREIVWILAISLLITNFAQIFIAAFRAYQKMEYESWFSLLDTFLFTAVGFIIIFYFPSVRNLSLGHLLISAASALTLLFFYRSRHRLKLLCDIKVWQKFLTVSWPLAAAVIFSSIAIYLDSIMLGYWNQITQNGWYSAAYKIFFLLIIPVNLVAQVFSPLLNKSFIQSKEKLQSIWNYSMESMIILAVPLMTGGLILAPKIIAFLYGPTYEPSVLALQILLFVAGIYFLSSPFFEILIVFNQQKKTFYLSIIVAVTNIILNYLLIPPYSLYGAGAATLITYSISFAIVIFFVKRFTSISFLNAQIAKTVIYSLLSALIMYFFIVQPIIYNLPIILIITIGAAVYFIFLFILHRLEKFLKLEYS